MIVCIYWKRGKLKAHSITLKSLNTIVFIVFPRVLLEVVENLLERILDEEQWNGTHISLSTLNLVLHTAHNITTALTDTLQSKANTPH